MTKDYLLLLTISFPYGYGEPFIASELEFLCNEYNNVIIVPFKSEVCRFKREIPKNVVIHRANKLNFFKKISLLLQNIIWNKHFRNEFFYEILYSKIYLSKKKFLSLIYWTIDFLIYYQCVSSILHKNKITKDKVDLYSYWGNSAAAAIAIYSKYKGFIAFNRLHGYDIYEERHSCCYLPYRKLIYQNNHIFTICNQGKSYLLSKYSSILSNEYIHVSRLGTNYVLTKKYFEKKKTFYRILSVSSIIAIKRLNLIFEAVVYLSKMIKKYDFEWVHIGDGNCKADLMKSMKFIPDNLNIDLKGYMEHSEIIDYYQNNEIDLFVNASLSEGVPVSIMEAQSCFVPVLAPNVGGTSEIVNKSNGWLLEQNFALRNMQETIISIFSDFNFKEVLFEKGLKSYENWKENYNSKLNYTNFISQIKKLKNTKEITQ